MGCGLWLWGVRSIGRRELREETNTSSVSQSLPHSFLPTEHIVLYGPYTHSDLLHENTTLTTRLACELGDIKLQGFKARG